MLKQHMNIPVSNITKQGCLIPRQHLFTNSIYSLLLVILFSYKHVVCFDLSDPSCLHKREEEGYYSESCTDSDYTGHGDLKVALHKAERTHEQ